MKFIMFDSRSIDWVGPVGPVCGLVGGSCECGGTEGGWVGHEGVGQVRFVLIRSGGSKFNTISHSLTKVGKELPGQLKIRFLMQF